MPGFLPKGGGYRNLRVYKLTEIIYDLTVVFARKYIPAGSRTCDQMVQAARSGKQNIAEGSEASMTSKETEIKLTNVARASLGELLLDYQDYLRQKGFEEWSVTHPRVIRLREYLRSDLFLGNPMEYVERLTDMEYSNLCITLINQAQSMLRSLINRQEQDFLRFGGIREQMSKARREYRDRNRSDQTDQKV